MISYTQSTIGDYKVFCANMELGDVLSITLENPQPEQHTHKNSMVVSGQMRISIKEYSTVVKTGDNAKFRPRAGLTPFDVGDVVTLTSTEPTRYVCVEHALNAPIKFEAVTVQETLLLDSGALVISTGNCTVNGVETLAGVPILATEGSFLTAPANTKIGIFSLA